MPTQTATTPLGLKKILVPLDFSDCSRKALQYAVAFAKQFDAELVLLNVVDLNYQAGGYGPVDFPLIETQLRQSATKELASFDETLVHGAARTARMVKSGRPVQEIVEAAKTMDADLIILSTHGYTGLKHFVMGSTAETVVRYAPCPVLVVRENEHDFLNN